MKIKIINTGTYLLLIDENDICKTGELYLTFIQNRIIPKSKGVIQAGDKIIAYYSLTKEAKPLDLPLLPNPFKKVDVEKLAKEAIPNYEPKSSPNKHFYTYLRRGFVQGYKAAQSKQFSLEDMKEAIEMAKAGSLIFDDENYGFDFKYKQEEIIQSLSTQQLPEFFEPEYEYYVGSNDLTFGNSHITPSNKLKKITNSEGKHELLGIYKY